MDILFDSANCPVTHFMKVMGGKWKAIIVFRIANGMNRFGVLQGEIEGINKQMLSKQLRELEDDGIISRKVFPEIPPRVEYSITEKGKSLFPIINTMRVWGERSLGISTPDLRRSPERPE